MLKLILFLFNYSFIKSHFLGFLLSDSVLKHFGFSILCQKPHKKNTHTPLVTPGFLICRATSYITSESNLCSELPGATWCQDPQFILHLGVLFLSFLLLEH